MWRAKPHCTILLVGKQKKATPEGPGVASSSQNKSCQCIGCMKKKGDVNFKRCSSCKWLFYCSQTCQERHFSEHQQLCKAIQKEVSPHWDNPKGLGDSADSEVFVSHLTSRIMAYWSPGLLYA